MGACARPLQGPPQNNDNINDYSNKDNDNVNKYKYINTQVDIKIIVLKGLISVGLSSFKGNIMILYII